MFFVLWVFLSWFAQVHYGSAAPGISEQFSILSSFHEKVNTWELS